MIQSGASKHALEAIRARGELRVVRDVGDGGDRGAEHLAPVRLLGKRALGN